jgi:ribosomal protein S12 methylthiotransferase
LKTKTLQQNKVNVITLGCSKNLVDSEDLITQLKGNDIDVTHESEKDDANIIIVNTCGFIDLAKEESINTILEYAAVKNEGGIDKLYVTGCLSQRYKDQLEEDIPEVDAYFGTMEMPSLLARLNADYKHELVGERWISTPAHYAYLKISEGCNRTCSFCAIPLMRGKHISKSIENCVKEARNLAKYGTKEIMLIAQELTYYGLDLYKKRALPELLKALNEVDGIEWIRLHYAYPSKFPLEILDAIVENDKVCNYLDIPLQHISDHMLKAMHRQITKQETKDLIEIIRAKVPNIAIRTTFLVGHPGETESDFEELCQFVEEMRFDRVGVFQYSHEEDTQAYDMVDDVPPETKAERAATIMEIQETISLEKNQAKIGNQFKIIVDRKEGEYYIGRSEFDSPEVDNEVLIDAKNKYLRIGDFVQVKVIDAQEFDLIAEVI